MTNTPVPQPPIERRSPETDNPAASFEVGIMALKGDWIGICIKFSMYDRSTRLTHWSLRAFLELKKALQEYFEHLGMGAFISRANADPALVARLPARHPYHTLLSEVPKLTENEVGTASVATGIDEAKFVVRGPTFEIRPVYGDGRSESVFLHEYTALSLLGYLEEYMEAAAQLTGPAAGNA